ncbi:serine hydrolase domain-containing protein [Sphingomonas sp. Leaf339]|uniref:serine hydrolase domain-containing protein n=1 Tax=Sphingomonas sp. Leaf339 TaxID=1736343 RepID=UPI002285C51D|nr:serine hydrolase domain-containing protein [Sphingomonas sp. Leaf339]
MGAAGAALSTIARGANVTPSGVVGLTCSMAGVSGIISQGEDGAVLDPSFRWHIGSNTKAMTAALYARMVDLGRCRWAASVPSLFPTIASHPAWADIRIEELLSHSAGLTDTFIDGRWLDARRADAKSAREQRRDLVERVLGVAPPESRGVYRYGNLNYVMVGAAIEQAISVTWEEGMQSEVFATLRIAEAGFGAPPRTGPWGREASGSKLKPIDPSLGEADNPAVLWPSGGVHISASGYAQFLASYLHGGPSLVRPTTLKHLLTPAEPDLGYAGGWSLDGPSASPASRLTHDGSNTLWFASAIIDRKSGRGCAALTNCGGERGAAITQRIIKRISLTSPRA